MPGPENNPFPFIDTISPGQVKNGNPLPQPQWQENDYDPTRGVIYKSEWESSNSEYAYQQWQAYVQNGIACRIRFELGRAHLTVDDSTQLFVLDSWSLGSNDEQVSVFLNPIIYADLENNTDGGYPAAIASLKTSLENNEDQDQAFSKDIFNDYFDGPQNMWFLYPELQGGLTSYRNAVTGEGYVLRHRTNVSNQWLENIADFGTGTIYSLAQLLTEVSSTALWNNPCPARLQYKMANFISPPVLGGWQIGYFKDRSTEETAANNRIDITTEYTYGQWIDSLYSLYNGLT
jgi:hypothetical protein